jgi:hypothetical protein
MNSESDAYDMTFTQFLCVLHLTELHQLEIRTAGLNFPTIQAVQSCVRCVTHRSAAQQHDLSEYNRFCRFELSFRDLTFIYAVSLLLPQFNHLLHELPMILNLIL